MGTRAPRTVSGYCAVLALASLVGGCTLVQLRSDARTFYGSTVLAGRVSAMDWAAGVTVAAVADDAARGVVHQTWLHEPGGYEVIVPPGRYLVQAFADADGNGVADAGAPLAGHTAPIDVTDSGLVTLVDLQLAPGPPAWPQRLAPTPPHSTQAGAVVRLDDARFGPERGRQGYWAPMENFHDIGGNVYFLQPFDPARIPVLFVHGAGGAAQDWTQVVQALDPRYQPWVFQYPSGASLDSMSHLLYWKLVNLRARHGFTRLHLVAHSMGGLLVRRFLLDHGAEFHEIDTFVSISTPWAGHAAATLGVAHSPAVIPSWRDMQPDGDFLRTLFERPLPPQVRHALLFGHRGGSLLHRTGSDGTVTLASQLRHEAEAAAAMVLAFDADHAGILSSPSMHTQLGRVLDASGNAGESGDIAIVVPATRAAAATLPVLVLQPVGRGAPLLLPLEFDADGRSLRRVPAGDYDVRLAVAGQRSSPAWQRVQVRPSEQASVAFVLTGQGMLVGTVATASGEHARPAGAPAADVPHAGLHLVLEGAGLRRSLVPADIDQAALLSAWSDGRSAASGAWFGFAGLADGDYTLHATLPGFMPYRAEHRVMSGEAVPALSITLQPIR